jgi:hypothetical protein
VPNLCIKIDITSSKTGLLNTISFHGLRDSERTINKQKQSEISVGTYEKQHIIFIHLEIKHYFVHHVLKEY